MIRAVDLFCGAGGTSEGLAQAAAALGKPLQLTAINHWHTAVETHSRNHPDAEHLCADIDSLTPGKVVRGKLDLLVASPSCVQHSMARGNRTIDDQDRASAWCVVRWAESLRPRFICVENVSEWQKWGPLTLEGRPWKGREGETFRAWVAALESCGYRVAMRVLNAADFGDATTRRRLFILAWRGRGSALWPEETHAEHPGSDLFGPRSPWRAAREVIDWEIQGGSIFDRRKPLAAKTLQRIADGLRRFGGAAADPWLRMLDGGAPEPADPVEPFMLGQQSGAVARPVSKPVPTVATSGAVSLIEPFVVSYYGTGGATATRQPLPTITTRDRFGLVEPRLADIRFRMLQPHELSAAQGFPADYSFAGTKSEVVKQVGNSVPVGTARALCSGLLGRCA